MTDPTRTPPPRFHELGFTEPPTWPWPLEPGKPIEAPTGTLDGQPLDPSPWEIRSPPPISPVDDLAAVQPVDHENHSQEGATPRPLRILLDLDGPLADFDAEFHRRCVAEGWQFDADVCGPEDQRHRFFTDHMPKRKQRRKARAMVDGPGWFRGLPVTPGALEGVAALLEAGHDVWVVTKPLPTSATCLSEKQAWLNEWFPALVDRMVTTADKSLVRGDLLLDDAVKTQWIGDAEWQPVVYSTPFSGADSEWAGLPRWTWADGIDRLVAMVPPASIDQLVASITRQRRQRAIVEPLLATQAARLGVQ